MTVLEIIGLIIYVALMLLDWKTTVDAIFHSKVIKFEECTPIPRFFLNKGKEVYTWFKVVTLLLVVVPLIIWDGEGLIYLFIFVQMWGVFDNIKKVNNRI